MTQFSSADMYMTVRGHNICPIVFNLIHEYCSKTMFEFRKLKGHSCDKSAYIDAALRSFLEKHDVSSTEEKLAIKVTFELFCSDLFLPRAYYCLSCNTAAKTMTNLFSSANIKESTTIKYKTAAEYTNSPNSPLLDPLDNPTLPPRMATIQGARKKQIKFFRHPPMVPQPKTSILTKNPNEQPTTTIDYI